MINVGLLKNLRHSRITNLKKGQINNQDAALLIMASPSDSGIFKSKEVTKQLQAWRGLQPRKHWQGTWGDGKWVDSQDNLHFLYLWNTSSSGGYGFVGKDVNSATNSVESFYEEHNRRTYWFRVKRGKYALTLEGYRRLAELQAQLS